MTTTGATAGDGNVALVFGASGEQGRAVIEGLLDDTSGRYSKVVGFTRHSHDPYLTDALGCELITGDIANIEHVENALVETKATCIFLVTTTELPSEIGQTTGFWNAMEEEYETIIDFFKVLIKVFQCDKLSRHVVFSTCDNVQDICRKIHEQTGITWINPLDDGSIVPHYSAKGRGGCKAQEMITEIASSGSDDAKLYLTRVTLPFLYSNFLGFFAPLPTDDNRTQWQLSACFGDGENKIDMMNVSDLSTLVPHLFEQRDLYNGKNLRIASEHISMDMIAKEFADLFGKDVIYNPLQPNELIQVFESIFPSVPAMTQMCQFWARIDQATLAASAADNATSDENEEEDDRKSVASMTTTRSALNEVLEHHDIELTKKILFPKKPTTFKDWLLTHSDSTAFTKVGLDLDAPEILSVTVFGATSPQGISVIKGLLQDTRKKYFVRGTTRELDSKQSQALIEMANNIIKDIDDDDEADKSGDNGSSNTRKRKFEMVEADLDDTESCINAVNNIDGAFLVTDFFQDKDRHLQQIEEKHAKNVIDACESSHSVKHLVFSTMENIEEMNHIYNNMNLDLLQVPSNGEKHYAQQQEIPNGKKQKQQEEKSKQPEEEDEGYIVGFDAKAKAAAYARTKKLSVTYVLMPCYSELFFDMIEKKSTKNNEEEKLILTIPLQNKDAKVMCMSVDDLGPAVANIFDSYQVYAGHEIGLVTDFVTVSDVQNIIQDVFYKDNNGNDENNNNNNNGSNTIEHHPPTPKSPSSSGSTICPRDTYMKDLGQMFAYLSHTDAVKKRHSIAKTMKLVPSAKPLRKWVEQNKDNPSFREKLGLR